MRLPLALPDELIFSRLIRYLAINGISGNQYLKEVFGSDRISLHPFLTAGLNRLAEFHGESPESLLYNQTLAPLFMLCHPEHAVSLKQLMLSDRHARAFRESQMPSFGKGKTAILKFCPLCATDDIMRFGVAYWHRYHQIPGITACFSHGIQLRFYTLAMRQRLLGHLLPDNFQHYCDHATDTEICVSQYGHDLLNENEYMLTGLKITLCYLSRLSDLGLLTRNHRIRRASLMPPFYNYCMMCRSDIGTPVPASITDYRYVSELLTSSGSHHPFRHLLFSSWLFGTVQQFLKTHENMIGSKPQSEDNCMTYENSLATLQNSQKELSAITPGTAKGQHYESVRRKCKVRLIRYWQAHPLALRSDIAKACSREFFWLYNHERHLLYSIMPAARRPQGPRNIGSPK